MCAKIFNRPVLIAGEKRTIGGVAFTILEYDRDYNISRATTEEDPSTADGEKGFAIMAEVRDTTNKDLYKNTGTTSVCAFTEFEKGDTGATGATGAGDEFESVELTFSETATTATGTVTSGSVPAGFYVSGVTGQPDPSNLELSVSDTTLTGILTHTPGEGDAIAFTVSLKKA
jgi:hypothetical protein